MALVAAQEWGNDMDNISRQQRNSPVHNSNDGQQPQNPYSQGPYAYPQQPWNMNMPPQAGYFSPVPFYPQHFAPPPPGAAVPPGPAFGQAMFDPNAQFAQWAYQQMMFNAQQQQLPLQSPQQIQQQSPSQQPSSQQSSPQSQHPHRSLPSPQQTDYFQTNQVQQQYPPGRFQSGTPPTHQPTPPVQNAYQGFHPYRRPDRGDRPRAATFDSPTNGAPFQPPYARSDAAGSTTSVNSNGSVRSRKNSATSASGSVRTNVNGASSSGSTTGSIRGGAKPPSSSSSGSASQTPRVSSSSSQASTPRSVSSSSTSSLGGGPNGSTRTQRPSPLSQAATYSAAERRKSRDDSDIAAMLSSGQGLGIDGGGGTASAQMAARNGFKGRIRRALSFNAVQTLREEDEDDVPIGRSRAKEKSKDSTDGTDDGDEASMATKKTKKSLRIFNARFNASTDNISLSSTVSSASVMIRKLGSIGRLARRNSLAGITSLFKDKEKKKKDGDDDPESSGKKYKGKAGKAEATVSHVTAEIEAGSNEWSAPGSEGLTPAAAIARQHTLKSKAEAAARARAQSDVQGSFGSSVPTPWEKNTATRHGVAQSTTTVREDGMRVVIEEDSDDDDDDEPLRRREAPLTPGRPQGSGVGVVSGPRKSEDGFGSGSDDDEASTWRGHGEDDEEDGDEDVTIRIGMEKSVLSDLDEDSHLGHGDHEDGLEIGEDDQLDEPWAMNIRRSVERSRRPTKGILKNAEQYSQSVFLDNPSSPFARVRANSYDSVPAHQSEAGPLARIPTPDPDHIDGLHRHGSVHSTHSTKNGNGNSIPSLPPLSFDTSDSLSLTPPSPELPSPSPTSSLSAVPEKEKTSSSLFQHPNASAPALSTMLTTSAPSPPTLTHRSATAPAKRLAFAPSLSIYDTFPPSVYDRRSEPATWSRLTPALAQRIKEELNSYKMEEMEVHAASRVHTQFFV